MISSLRDAIAELRARRRHRCHGGIHSPHSPCRRSRDHPPGAPQPHLVRMTPDMVYDQLIGVGLRDQAHLLVGRQPGRRFAATFP